MSITGKVALITGSADGIGKSIALLFAKEGARLMICDINPEALQKTEREIRDIGADVASIQYDGRSLTDIDRVFDKLRVTYGDIDILINNTGIAGPTKPVTDVSPEEWDETLEVNLRGPFYFMKKAAPYMIRKNSGKIVCIASQSGKNPLPNRSPYCASKMGVIGLVRCVASELGQYEINVNAICPGMVEGTRLDLIFEGLSKSRAIPVEELKKELLRNNMIERPASPDDVARMALYLSDDEMCRSVTGQDFNINCGMVVH